MPAMGDLAPSSSTLERAWMEMARGEEWSQLGLQGEGAAPAPWATKEHLALHHSITPTLQSHPNFVAHQCYSLHDSFVNKTRELSRLTSITSFCKACFVCLNPDHGSHPAQRHTWQPNREGRALQLGSGKEQLGRTRRNPLKQNH